MAKRFLPLLITVILFEIVFRIYFAVKVSDFKVFFLPQNILYQYYPTLEKQSELKAKGQFNILLLGGSVINPNWSDFEKLLIDSLKKETDLAIKVNNHSQSSHTSLDSKIKYQFIENKNYDIILLYHGINELRFNLCSEEQFQEDYSHIAFYQKVYALKNWTNRLSIIPYSYAHFSEIVQTNLFPNQSITLGSPLIDSLDKNLLRFGTDIKTASSFYKNYEYVIKQSIKNKSTIIVPSFASYVPDNYSFENFKEHKLDYVEHTLPIELWGTPKSVEKGLKKHNTIIRKVTSKHQSPYLVFIELDSLLDKPEFYNDVCHLSTDGIKRFVSHSSLVIKQLIKQKELNEYGL